MPTIPPATTTATTGFGGWTGAASSGGEIRGETIWDYLLASLADLDVASRQAFEADKFELGKIPIMPPPVDCR